jgi:hypothetical protein
MPRYFFHIHDGQEILDHEGTVVASPDEARAEAITMAGAMLKEKGRSFWTGTEWRMRVTDDVGKVVCSLDFVARDGEAALPCDKPVEHSGPSGSTERSHMPQ